MRGGRWEVGGGRWEVGGERWEVRGGRWEVGGGRGEVGCEGDINTSFLFFSLAVTNPKPRQSRQWAFALGGGGLGLVGASFFGLVLYSKYKKLRGRGNMEVDMLIRK